MHASSASPLCCAVPTACRPLQGSCPVFRLCAVRMHQCPWRGSHHLFFHITARNSTVKVHVYVFTLWWHCKRITSWGQKVTLINACGYIIYCCLDCHMLQVYVSVFQLVGRMAGGSEPSERVCFGWHGVPGLRCAL